MAVTQTLPQFSTLAAFDHHPRTRLVFGVNSLDRLGELARQLNASKVLLVTDPGIVAAGHSARAIQFLESAGLKVSLFDKVIENPTTRVVNDCLALANAKGIDTFVALGGGSSMDTAKGCNFLLSNGGKMQDYWGVGKAAKPMLPMIAIPTTAGTGSECQSAALIANEETHEKMACLDTKAAARIAILDPALTLSQPRRVTACTGIDAIAHVVETAVTKKRNAFSLMCAHEGFKLTVPSFHRVFEAPEDIEARGRMLLGAAFAGMAIENSMLGAAHSAANPLTAHFGIVHGQAVGLMLPHVVRFNGKDPEALKAYAELASAPEIACVSDGLEEALEALIQHLESLLDTAKMPRSLSECGVKRSTIPMMAEEASKQWTASFNPRRVDASDFASLYEAAMEPRKSP
ncbi:MAG TPA: iron-containing alcohol dehydrogenase [Candidatus Saccharimonadales bacterium]|nr:iron-containing alcohol dehydrogenase [Candidatus Saccharimonadales bacterium]